jgi:hypothetical protein
VSFFVRRHKERWERWERWLILWKVQLNLPLKTHEKQKYNGSMYLRNIRNYTVEDLQGSALLLGSAEYLRQHEDFWRTAVQGECRPRLLENNTHHLDILDPVKSDQWIRCVAELCARSHDAAELRKSQDNHCPAAPETKVKRAPVRMSRLNG